MKFKKLFKISSLQKIEEYHKKNKIKMIMNKKNSKVFYLASLNN
jgi:hypothetical protein